MGSENITRTFGKTVLPFGCRKPHLRLKHFEQNEQVKGLCATSKAWSDLGYQLDGMFSNAVVDGEACVPF
jgi:hypothetical protein